MARARRLRGRPAPRDVTAGWTHPFPIVERGDSVGARDLSWDFFMTGATVTLTARPTETATFAGWSGGGCSGGGLTCTISPPTDTTVTATFNRL